LRNGPLTGFKVLHLGFHSIFIPEFSLRVFVFLWFMSVTLCLAADTPAPTPPPDAIVDHYCSATRAQEGSLAGASMEVDMNGYLPKLQKHGKLHALRRISPLGLIKYEKLFFEGDRTVNKEVIQRYLNAEVDLQKEHHSHRPHSRQLPFQIQEHESLRWSRRVCIPGDSETKT